MEGTIHIEPTIIRRRDEEVQVVANVPDDNALLVFRNEEDAGRFRATTGRYPADKGYEAVYMDARDLARTCIQHGFTQVCMPGPWTGTRESGADFFKAHLFVKMLVDSVAVEE